VTVPWLPSIRLKDAFEQLLLSKKTQEVVLGPAAEDAPHHLAFSGKIVRCSVLLASRVDACCAPAEAAGTVVVRYDKGTVIRQLVYR
jgi:hypothetical protein